MQIPTQKFDDLSVTQYSALSYPQVCDLRAERSDLQGEVHDLLRELHDLRLELHDLREERQARAWVWACA